MPCASGPCLSASLRGYLPAGGDKRGQECCPVRAPLLLLGVQCMVNILAKVNLSNLEPNSPFKPMVQDAWNMLNDRRAAETSPLLALQAAGAVLYTLFVPDIASRGGHMYGPACVPRCTAGRLGSMGRCMPVAPPHVADCCTRAGLCMLCARSMRTTLTLQFPSSKIAAAVLWLAVLLARDKGINPPISPGATFYRDFDVTPEVGVCARARVGRGARCCALPR
jgi:hypothetical protein